MGSITIPIKWYVNDVLTNATSAKLSDPTGTYGVKRDDTDAVVVADGTAMTNVGAGLYRYTFTEPAEGLAYTAYVEIVYGGQTYHFERSVTGHQTAPTIGLLDFSELCVEIADMLGLGRDSTEWSTDETSRLGRIVNSGYWQFLYPPPRPGEHIPHRWRFLTPTTSFDTVVDDYDYDLGTTFGGIEGDLTYAADDGEYHSIQLTGEAEIRQKRQGFSTLTGSPDFAAYRPKNVNQGDAQDWELILFPTPDAVYTITYSGPVTVTELSATYPYPLGGQPHQETLLQSCRDKAAQFLNDDSASAEHGLFLERLSASVEWDRRNGPRMLGYNSDGELSVRAGREPNYAFTASLRRNLS